MRRETAALTLESRVGPGPDVYRFRTADGVCSPDEFRVAECLLLEHLWDLELGRLVVFAANYGVVGTVLAERATTVRMLETSARATRLCEANAGQNGVDTTTTLTAQAVLPPGIDTPQSPDGNPRTDPSPLTTPADTVVYAPKPYTPIELGVQRLANALDALRPGGRLFVAAAPETGLHRYESFLESHAAEVIRVAAHDGCVLLRAAALPEFHAPAVVSPRTVSATVAGVDLEYQTVPGLFSASQLDDGTRLLLESTAVAADDRILDLCCGAGPVGVWAARQTDREVYLSDDNRVATTCANWSLGASSVEGRVVTADCLRGLRNHRFDLVLTNPPTHAGEGVLAELLGEVPCVLAPDGRLRLVHHRALDLDHHLHGFERVEHVTTGREHVVVEATESV